MDPKELGEELAFPGEKHNDNGLTKREYFAGLALQGMIGSIKTVQEADKLGRACVAAADALLAELAKGE